MKEPLSHFVKYTKTINDITFTKKALSISTTLDSIVDNLSSSDFDLEALNDLKDSCNRIKKELNNFNNSLKLYKKHAFDFLRKNDKHYLSLSYKIYKDMPTESPKLILDKSLFNSLIYKKSIEKYFISRITSNSSWKYPGLYIRPEHGKFVQHMVASDPLYVVDTNFTLLKPVQRIWSKTFLDRVRFKLIDENRDHIFKDFPTNTFGLVVIMDYLNNKPFEIIKRYLREILILMRPGGSLLFTFNNCDLPIAVKKFEKMSGSYTPGALVKMFCESLGFEIVEEYNHIDTNVSWLEVKKPGTIRTLRGGQCLGKIIT